jgi:hypothetical protein
MKSSLSKTKLKDHKLIDKKLIPPLATIGMTPSSWIDNRLPDMLWAVLLTNKFSREEVLKRFATIVDVACEVTDTKSFNIKDNPLTVTISGIASLNENKKQKMMEVIAKDDDAKKSLVPMLFFDNLPDKKKWESVLKLSPIDDDWENLAQAVAGCFYHQSQKATDCRWIKALFLVKTGIVKFTKNVEQTPKLILEYQNHNEEQLRTSRAGVRAFEIGLDFNKNDWPRLFWDECYKKTQCIFHKISKEEMKSHYPPHDELAQDNKKLQEINQNLSDHFWRTAKGSDKDPKHEVVFGLALYATDLAASSILLGMGRSSQGRMVLRGLVECLISLKYLITKDSLELWMAFQSHGTGQAKLVVQRLEEEKRSPKYLNQENLGQIANDDVWVEFLPINIGSWDDSDLRKRAIEVELKDKYDDYYTWPSSYSHGQWGAIRESVYTLCGNPLHRFHRIPLLFSMNLEETHEDVYLLLNDILKLLYEVFPKEK